MPWQCRLVYKHKDRLEVGDMWYVDYLIDAATGAAYCEEGGLSDDYVRDHAGKRAPLAVVLPNGDIFGIDTHITGSRRGWTVTGEAPNITVSPSINFIGRYHGWLQNGVLSEDVEGRTFPR